MKKTLWILVLVLVVAYPGIVWVMGRVTEERVQERLAQLTQQTPYVKVVAQHYRRGWYRSEQDLTVELAFGKLLPLPPLAANRQRASLSIRSVIHHGPICGLTCFGVARVDSTFVSPSELAPLISRWYGARPPLSVSSRLGFFGGSTTSISTPPLRDLVLKDGSHLDWDGFVIDVSSSRSRDRFSVRASVPRLAVRGADGKYLEVSALTLDSTSRRALGMLYSTDVDLGIDRVIYHAPGTSAFSVEKFRYVVQSPVAAGYMDMAEQIGTGSLRAAGVQLKETHFDFTLRHLQVQALAMISDQMRALNQMTGPSPRPDVTRLFAALREPVRQLLLARPELTLDRVGVVTANGQILLRGWVRAPGLTAADFSAGMDPKALGQKIESSLDFTADDRALADLPTLAAGALQQLPVLARQGYVTLENGRWHATIQLSRGRATVNGKALPAPSSAPPPLVQ